MRLFPKNVPSGREVKWQDGKKELFMFIIFYGLSHLIIYNSLSLSQNPFIIGPETAGNFAKFSLDGLIQL